MKRILILCSLVICITILASTGTGDGDYAIRRLIEEGNGDWDSSRIASVLAMSSELADVLTAEEHPIIPPVDLVYYDPDLEYGLIIHIRDSIKTTRFRLGSPEK